MENKKIKIAVAGTGYVGLSIATLLSQHHEVVAVDVVPEKVELINSRRSPIQDEYIEKYLTEKELNLKATTDGEEAYKDADFGDDIAGHKKIGGIAISAVATFSTGNTFDERIKGAPVGARAVPPGSVCAVSIAVLNCKRHQRPGLGGAGGHHLPHIVHAQSGSVCFGSLTSASNHIGVFHTWSLAV